MKVKPRFIFDPIKSEENFEMAVFWDSPEVIKKMKEGLNGKRK